MRKYVIIKLKSTSGESIAETLVAVLIAAFALLMLAGTINSASNLITKSKTKLNAYYEKNNALSAEDTSVQDETNIELEFASNGAGAPSWITSRVNTYKNDEFSGNPVIAYGLP